MGRYILLLFLKNIFILSPISTKQKNISLKIKQNVIFKKYNLFLPHASNLIIKHKKYNKKKNFSY